MLRGKKRVLDRKIEMRFGIFLSRRFCIWRFSFFFKCLFFSSCFSIFFLIFVSFLNCPDTFFFYLIILLNVSFRLFLAFHIVFRPYLLIYLYFWYFTVIYKRSCFPILSLLLFSHFFLFFISLSVFFFFRIFF